LFLRVFNQTTVYRDKESCVQCLCTFSLRHFNDDDDDGSIDDDRLSWYLYCILSTLQTLKLFPIAYCMAPVEFI
jgi:hypothetical protein